MTQAATYTMETFVEDVRQIFATTQDPRTQAQEVARHMQALLCAPGWLEERIHLPAEGGFTDDEVTQALTRGGKPTWTEQDFHQLLHTLGCAGYGWLRPEGVRHELEKMAATWQGPPPLVEA